MKQQLTAIDHVTNQGMDSRTTKFNATLGAVAAFSAPMLAFVPESYEIAKVAVPSSITFLGAMGNIWLYGATHVKHSSDRNNL